MFALNNATQWKSFAARFVFPTAVTIALFVISIFSIIIPTIEKNSLDRKREMIRELTNSAWNILAKLEHDADRGLLTRAQAQAQAIEQIKNLHYGQEMKDYFWINDMHPRMVIHPYRTDLNGRDLTDYTDPEGKRVFVEFVETVKKHGAGYVDYRWQWKDNEKKIVPKISYVKGFAPWGWIIGTGIYIDDVQAEISSITRNLIEISLFILFIMALLLASIIRQSYASLRQQQQAEQALRESEEKYRTLVESAGEGMLLCLEGRFIHANQTISELLGYSGDEFGRMPVIELFAEPQDHPSRRQVQELAAGRSVPDPFETRLRTRAGVVKDVILSTSDIEIGGRHGFMAVVTDITQRKEAEAALGQSETRFRTLANNINVGLFRRTLGEQARFIEVNPAAVKLFGYDDKGELLATPLSQLYCNPEDRKNLEPRAGTENLRREIVRLRKKDGAVFTASIWGVVVEDDDGMPAFVDGIIDDITDIKAREVEQERLLSEMQTALLFFNQPLGSVPCHAVSACPAATAVREAVGLLEHSAAGALLVLGDGDAPAGVITDHDLRKALTGQAADLDRPVTTIMSTPVLSLPASASVFDSWLFMKQHRLSHLFVAGAGGALGGVLRSEDIISIQKNSPAVLLWEIQSAATADEVIHHNAILPYIVTSLINSGAKPQNINRLTTIVIETIVKKLIDFAIAELGPPPVRFAFLVFGSEGRQEQTLRTDQDNAIVFDDVEQALEGSIVQQYFLKLGAMVCRWLNQAGYTYCDGNNMAQNPQWCQPLTAWKRYFSQWVHAASAEDLLKTKIFFDFRPAYGAAELADELRSHLDELVSGTPRFFQLLARNVLTWTPPIGLFGKFVVEAIDDNRKAFDIKGAMMPIIDYARIYALRHTIRATNTLERLNALHDRGVLSRQNHQEMVQAFSHLMQIRLQVQAEGISRGNRNPDNYVTPKHLTYIEQKLLKEIFSQIKNFQARLSYDFTGQLGGL